MKLPIAAFLALAMAVSACVMPGAPAAPAAPTPTPAPAPPPENVTPSAEEAAPSLAPTPTEAVREIILEADDAGFYPSGTVEVDQGETVRITFEVRTGTTYFGGLDFRSEKFNTGTVKPGESTTVEFIADKPFTFTSYWPASNVKKADGQVVIR